MTDVIFSFDTEDFTSPTAADAIYREAELLFEDRYLSDRLRYQSWTMRFLTEA